MKHPVPVRATATTATAGRLIETIRNRMARALVTTTAAENRILAERAVKTSFGNNKLLLDDTTKSYRLKSEHT